MAKTPTRTVARVIEGYLPSTNRWHRITVWSNNSITIERDGFAVLEETDADAHYHLCGLIEDNPKPK